MKQDIIATIEAEEAELVRKLDAVRRLLAVYGVSPPSGVAKPETNGTESAVRAGREAADRMDKFGPYGQRVVDFVDRALPGCNANPIPTREIVDYLTQQRIGITGENKVNSLSALLARSSKMRGWGRAGWTRAGPESGDLLVQLELSGKAARSENGEAEASPEAEEAPTSSNENQDDPEKVLG